jgi:predicted Zn-dependent peptidase
MEFLKKNVFRFLIGWLLLLCLSVNPAGLAAAPKNNESRDDGLIVIKAEIPTETAHTLCLVSLILKTGYANDPDGQSGLTELTNHLLYRVFLNSSALDIHYHTYANFSKFNFVVSVKDFKTFCTELDSMIRTEALLLYDECSELIQDYKSQPQVPGSIGEIILYRMLYGNTHPYLAVFKSNYPDLNIDVVNSWFRKIYRPNNLMIASSIAMPSDFLLKPSGREMKEAVSFLKTPPGGCAPKPTINCAQIQDNISTIYIGLPGPPIQDNNLFTMIVMQRYLQKELYDKLREEMGLCYDVQVNYPYLQEPVAPSLIISLATLPADTDVTITKIIEILTGITANQISSERLSGIKEQEKNRAELQYNSIFYQVDGLLYQKLADLTWLKDSEEYLTLFNQVTPDNLSQLASQRLKYLKIAVVGPLFSENLEQADRAITKLNKSLK